MATVYVARDVRHHRHVAIKVLKPEIAGALGPERFLREINIAAGLTHPHILPLHDSGEADGFLYYVMPFIEGESLRDRLQRERQLALAEALHVTAEIADALGYAHGQRVVHRDIKPENILLGTGHALVADFGIARAITAAGGDRFTETGITLGTPPYMSPEQTAGEAQLDGRSDIYSLACVCYEMLAGEPPFTGPTIQSIVHQQLVAQPSPVTHRRPDVPPGVEQALARALAKVPADRFATASEFAAALAAPGDARSRAHQRDPARSRRRWRGVAAVTVLVVAAVAVGVAMRGLRAPKPVATAAATIAVIPPEPVVPDTALARLGRELAITLSANLDGVGGIRTADAMTVLAQVHSASAPYSLEQSVALGRRLGASSVVHGSLLRSGSQVRLDVALVTTDGMRQIARASVTASPEDLSALTDSASWALLRQTWQQGRPPSPSLGAITTHRFSALRPFLDGERLLAASNFASAADAYQQAIAADSTFWLAYWRFAYVKGVWLGEPVDSVTRAAYIDHRGTFPERDRLLIEVNLADRLSISSSRLRSIIERYPDYWPAWFAYADYLVHQLPFTGTGYPEARAALEHTLGLNPDLAEGWTHLMWLAARQRDTAAAGRALVELTRLWGPARPSALTAGAPVLKLWAAYQYQLAGMVRSGGALDELSIERIAHLMATARPPERFVGGGSTWGYNEAEIAVRERALRLKPPPDIAAINWFNLALAWVARGSWDSALVAARHYVDLSPKPAAPVLGYQLAALGYWAGALNSSEVPRWRERATASNRELSGEDRAEIAWLDGLVATTRQDRRALLAARTELANSHSPSTPILARSLAAFDLDLGGRRRQAIDTLVALEWEEADKSWFMDGGCNHPFLPGVDRLIAARWLAAAGDLAEAAHLLKWNEAIFPRPYCDLTDAIERAISPLASLQQARLDEERGRTETARAYYEEFLMQYDLPVASHRHLVEEARAALARISGPSR
jgi:tetratricopeptide (TPR) repeat protein